MSLFNEEVRGQLEGIFKELKDDVTIALFTEESGCDTCKDTLDYMSELSGLSDKIHLKEYSLKDNAELAESFNVAHVPSIVLLDKDEKNHGVRYNGIPAGHEINSMITGLMEVSGVGEELPESFKERLDKVDKKSNIKVFVTLGCPHCPGAVSKAHKLALENEFIDAEMVECQTFPELANKYNVSSVPKIVVNDTVELVGNQPIEEFLKALEQ